MEGLVVSIKVLHIIPTLGAGGAERLLGDLTRRTSPAIEHIIVSMTDDPPFFPVSCRLESLRMSRDGASLRSFLAALRPLRARVRAARPDVVQGWLYHGNFATLFVAGATRAPIVWSIHNTTLAPGRSKISTRAIDRICAPLSRVAPRAIIYCTEQARITHEDAGYAPARGRVIENGVRTDDFRFDVQARRAIRAEHDLPEDALVVGCVARYDPQKDFPTLIDAFARLRARRPARLALVGAGCAADNRELVALLRAHRVEEDTALLGLRADVAGAMSALDVLVVASSYGEALSLVILEAACVGVHVVTTDVGGNHKLMLDQRLIAPRQNPAALADAIDHAVALLRTPDGESLLARRAALVRERHSIERAARLYEDLYREMSTAP
jgi:glycosyltransferase involved in cell wall biosynthesis